MKNIVFLRHGQAAETFFCSERTLTELGRNQAEKSALRLKNAGFVPEIIISSTLKRALQTAEIAKNIIFNNNDVAENNKNTQNVAENVKIPEIKTEKAIADQDYDAVMLILEAAISEYDNILIVGHVPIFEEMPYNLCGEAPRMRTGSFAWLEVEGLLPGDRQKNRLKENFIPISN